MGNGIVYTGENDGYRGNEIIRIDKKEMWKNQIEKIGRAELLFNGNEYEKAVEEALAGKMDMSTHHLVDGATLSCSGALPLHFSVKVEVDGKVSDNTVTDITELGKLFVPENKEMNHNNQVMALSTNTVGGKRGELTGKKLNIRSFGNCRWNQEIPYKLKDDEEKEQIKQWGTCYHRMILSSEWEDLGAVVNGNAPVESGEDGFTLNMMSILYCNQGGMIVPEISGQMLEKEMFSWTDQEIQRLIDLGEIEEEEYEFLVSIGGEVSKGDEVTDAEFRNTYRTFIAVCYEVLNRCKTSGSPDNIKDVVSSGAYSAYNEYEVGKPKNDSIKNAAIAVLLELEKNPIRNATFHYGRYKDKEGAYDIWLEKSKCSYCIVIGEGASCIL